MKNPFKHLAILLFSSLFIFSSCSKSDDDKEPQITTTYKLTLEATVPSEGETVFTTISYNKEDGTLVTLSNTTTSFSESFNIVAGFNVVFNVLGTNNATTSPDVFNTYYTIGEYENDVWVKDICSGGSMISGTAGSWTIKTNNNTTFDGTSCQ